MPSYLTFQYIILKKNLKNYDKNHNTYVIIIDKKNLDTNKLYKQPQKKSKKSKKSKKQF